MSKYNHIHSIPIESIPKEEIAIAIKEWAEGDKAMERLLWACYENGVKTDGCHTGMCPYLGLKYTGSNDKVIKLLAACINLEESQILISPDGGNPISGEDWYITNIGIGFETESIEKSGKNLDTLSSALNNDTSLKEKELVSLLLKLSDFLVDKESALKLRFNYSENKYSFSIECTPVNEEVSIYFDKLFKEANFFEAENPVKESKRRFWKIESDNLDDMINKLHESINYIINNYSLEPPTREEDITDLHQLARFKRKEFGNDVDSYERFVDWYEQKQEEIFSSYKK
ncbi:MAG: hypothetical protein IJG97_05365 [Bacilli bacterium]|nr:hypothetical protein [Bacilli bacterium]